MLKRKLNLSSRIPRDAGRYKNLSSRIPRDAGKYIPYLHASRGTLEDNTFHPHDLWVREFRLTFRPGNYIWSFLIGFWLIWEISGFWDRGSTQNFEPSLSSRVVWPGEPFRKKNVFVPYFPKIQWSFLKNTFSKNDFAPNVDRSL